MALQFYMTPGSCSTAIHIILEELEVPFEATIVNLPKGDHLKPDYLAINPKATVPALVRADGHVLTELSAMAYWLALAFPRGRLWPQDKDDAARAIELMTFVTATIHGAGFTRIFTTERFAGSLQNSQDVVAQGRSIVERSFIILEKGLAPDAYALGPYSVVDPILFYVAFWADKTNIPLPPKQLAHYQRMLTRPAVIQVLREEGYNPTLLGQSASRGRQAADRESPLA